MAALCASVMLLASCSPGSDPDDQGFRWNRAVVTGEDWRMCPCCGGWFVTIGEARYRIGNMPEGSTLDLRTEKLPLNVRIKWRKDPTPCMGDELELEAIEKE